MNDQMKYGLIGVVIGGVAVWSIMTTVVNYANPGMMNSNSNSHTGAEMKGNIDQHFIEQMIPHHEDAITMAKLAQTKAQRTEVKQLASNIIDSQGKEITQMKDWYNNWFGKDLPTDSQAMNQHGMMGDASDMASLEQATDFDKAFVEEMIPHHQMAIMMASMLKGGTQRPEMNKLADDIIEAQTSEIEMMKQWQKDWGYSQ